MPKTIKAGEVISALLLAGGWGSLLLSVAFYLLFWRVDNEPGARDIPGLMWAAVSFCSIGGLALISSHIYLLIKKAWFLLLIAWGICLVLLVCAIALSPFLLIFLV